MQTPAFYDTLFGDLPLEDWARHGARIEAEPWPTFARAVALRGAGDVAHACRILHEIAAMADLEPRHYLQAWSGMRELNCPEARRGEREVLGVVIEAAAEQGDAGHDILAVYADRSALYLDHAGAVITAPAGELRIAEEVEAVLAAAAAILPRIGPWNDKRLPPPERSNVRLNLLTPIGLCFGEGPFAAIARDPVGGPLVKAGATLVHRLEQQPKATVN